MKLHLVTAKMDVAVDVPTDKEGLLRFLNLMTTSPTAAVAAEKLTG